MEEGKVEKLLIDIFHNTDFTKRLYFGKASNHNLRLEKFRNEVAPSSAKFYNTEDLFKYMCDNPKAWYDWESFPKDPVSFFESVPSETMKTQIITSLKDAGYAIDLKRICLSPVDGYLPKPQPPKRRPSFGRGILPTPKLGPEFERQRKIDPIRAALDAMFKR